MELTFRIGTIEDKEQLQQLGLNAYGQFKNGLSEEGWNKMLLVLDSDKNYTDLLSKSTCFVCEADGEIVGMAFLVPNGNPTPIYPAEWSYIRMVGVHTSHGGKRIGKQLIQQCIDFAKQANETTIGLHTSELMHAARHIYEGLGFKQVRELEQHYGMRYWLYRLDL